EFGHYFILFYFFGVLQMIDKRIEVHNVSCYRIEPGTIAGIIAADLLLTLIIVVVTYQCASFRRQKIDNADKVYMNVRANVKNIK
uniref:Hematopoietic cell signal transducer n=1 Tax=Poecilia reticulata TaxID=8081 RepID=A0A3P9N3W7_POERE